MLWSKYFYCSRKTKGHVSACRRTAAGAEGLAYSQMGANHDQVDDEPLEQETGVKWGRL